MDRFQKSVETFSPLNQKPPEEKIWIFLRISWTFSVNRFFALRCLISHYLEHISLISIGSTNSVDPPTCDGLLITSLCFMIIITHFYSAISNALRRQTIVGHTPNSNRERSSPDRLQDRLWRKSYLSVLGYWTHAWFWKEILSESHPSLTSWLSITKSMTVVLTRFNPISRLK